MSDQQSSGGGDDTRPFVSVIIPVFNDARRLRRCLESLDRQTYPRERFEVTVVDNGSQESPEQVVRAFDGFRFEVEQAVGSYAARNRGIAMSRGDVFAFIDSDCIAAPNWIEKGVANLRANKGCGLVGGRVDVFPKDPVRPTAVELYEKLTAFDFKKYIQVLHVCGAGNTFTRPDVFERVGLFDDKLKSGGDFDWSGRVYHAGYRLIYADDVVIQHPARSRLAQLATKKQRVIGGEFDRKQSSWRQMSPMWLMWVLWRSFFPDMRVLCRLGLDRRLSGPGQRLRVVAVVVALQYAEGWERVRLRLGGKSRR